MTALYAAPAARWADLRSTRLEWAYRAYRRFIAELSDDVRAHLMDGNDHEPYVVVFGKTQVGKTTLLLELMGLGSEGQARVGKILRGGRESGKSATATTMEYRRSPDLAWRFDDGAGPRRIADDDEMCTVLGELRRRMSEQRLHLEQPVVVSIPADCFSGDAASLRTRMLDLPGDNPADEVERAHVERMAERYVPHADLILLVGRGDDLSFLNPAALKLPSIEDWQYVPKRFRIVTTYAFTPHTVRTFAESFDGALTAEHFRLRLLQQIGTFERALAPEATETARFFPLEIGDSWQAMLREDSPFRHRVEPVIQGLKASLHADIRESATEGARFRNALDVNIVTQRKREARRQEGEAALGLIADEIARTGATLQQARDNDIGAAAQLKQYDAMLAARAAVEEALEMSCIFDAADFIDRVDSLTKNTSAFFVLIGDVTQWLRKRYLDSAPPSVAVNAFFGTARPNLDAQLAQATRIANDEFLHLIMRMGAYKTSEYYPRFSDAWSKDKTRLKKDIEDAAAKTSQFAQSLWREHVDKRASELESGRTSAENTRIDMQQIAQHHGALLERLDAQAATLQADMDHAIARLDRDEKTAARFATMLDEEYLAELRDRRVQVAAAARPVDALLTLLSTADIGIEHRKITLS